MSGIFGVVSEGSCSLLLLNRTGIYAARDRFGYTPLVVGKNQDAWAVTSETCALPNTDVSEDLGVTTLRYQTIDNMVDAIGIDKDKLCQYCWTGKCPKTACVKPPIDIVETLGRDKREPAALSQKL